MKILLAIDGSPYSKKMLAYLCAHDELINAGAQHLHGPDGAARHPPARPRGVEQRNGG